MKFVISFILIVVFVLPAIADIPPEPDSSSIGMTFTHSGDTWNIGTNIGLPFDAEKTNGYAAVTAQQNRIKGKDTVMNRLAYLEAGIPFLNFEINVFGKGLRNTGRAVDQEYDGGWFLMWTPPAGDRWTFSAGYGNFARSTIEETGDASQTTFHNKFFLRLKNQREVSVLFEVIPAIDFDGPTEIYLTPTWNWKISDKLSLNLLLSWVWDEESHHQSITTLNYRF